MMSKDLDAITHRGVEFKLMASIGGPICLSEPIIKDHKMSAIANIDSNACYIVHWRTVGKPPNAECKLFAPWKSPNAGSDAKAQNMCAMKTYMEEDVVRTQSKNSRDKLMSDRLTHLTCASFRHYCHATTSKIHT
ncbi:hypothetical protein R3P38DRAFT_608103 [Favolaschia claudopus]|uniref:Uncharacterized protein n=1 Tax=Favolaschia claudopus TaxID=2862362 RepID=A0AAW0C9V2_9AGAR